ncbi:MAG: hypothetical protein U5N86_11785 [Planctomycetota bacterium]|nr:hypothetical protein [Planctomycetota bacterium]
MKRLAFLLSVAVVILALPFAAAEDSEKPVKSKQAPKTTPPRKSVKPVTSPPPTPTPIQIGKNLAVNGDFEKKNPEHDSPAHWQLTDGLTSFYEKDDKRGMVVRFDTAVPKEQARERWKVMNEKGVDAPPAPKKEKLKGIYGSIGAVDGIHYYSQKIPVKKGSCYRLIAYVKGEKPSANYVKIFVKGYGTITKKRQVRKEDGSVEEKTVTEVRQVFKWYLACRDVETTWKKFDEWIPCKMPQNVEFVKICLYPYWPNGEYYFDDIRFFEGKEPPSDE